MAVDSKSPARGAAPCSNPKDAWQPRQTWSQRECESVRSPSLGAHDTEGHHDHWPCSFPSSTSPLEDSRTTRGFGTPDDRDGRSVGEQSARASGDRAEPSSPRPLSARSGVEIFYPNGMVQGDINSITISEDGVTQARGTYHTQEYDNELPSVSTGHARSANGQYVGHSVQPRPESGQPAMSLRERGHALDLKDRAQSRSTFLEVRSGEESAVQFLPVADVSTSTPRPSGEFQHGVLHPTSAGHVLPQAHHQGRLQRPQFESEVQGLWEASLGREDTSGSHVAAEEESRGSHDTNVAILNGDSAQDGARQQGFPRVLDVAPCPGGDAEQLDGKTFEPHGTLHVSEGHQAELRPGLRRHIFGCLKRAELSWLEIHRLLHVKHLMTILIKHASLFESRFSCSSHISDIWQIYIFCSQNS